ncbi:MAG: lytic transglycosylase domain-containing protein [Alphaproteobacteria bacterium]|nr:lytic transglycosylase domain-containing protein [Alphaproteobacteria bacterium]
MPPVFRGLLAAVLLAFALGARAVAGQTLPAADLEAMRSALAAAQGADWPRAYAAAAGAEDPLPLKMLRWMDYARPGAPGRFPDIAGFIEKNPDWPGQKSLRKHAEEALAAESDEVAAGWFKRYPPVSAIGKVRQAEITINSGDLENGTAALRAAWITADFGPLDEKGFLARHADALRPEDHAQRTDRLLWDGQVEAAHRMLAILPPDYRLLAQARLALAAQAANAEVLVARVPPRLRADPGLVFEQLRWRRKKDMTDAAVQILLRQPNDLVRPAAWWAERQAIARRVLAGGNAELAYRLVEQHGLIEGNAFSDAQFLLGYIALHYMKNPALAFEHFSRILTRVDTPYAKSRAGYWGGRAAEAEGKPELAAKWYAAGADHMATFYGQLAAHQLGHDAPPRPVPEPVPAAAELAQFNDDEVVRAARIFFELGDQAHGKIFLLHMADKAKTPAKLAMLASLAEANGRIDLAIGIAKRAIEAGTPLMIHGYPVTEVPDGGTAEHSLLFAVVRQESAFERDAVSRVGARGLMQLMPATASFIANKLQLPFSADRLTADGIYNVILGRAYLETLIEDFGGSYALAIASYNAGPSRVRQWIRDYGDPRGGSIDMVDWIEMIPINETRNYVQRVLENLQIYRGQVGRDSAFSLASDLAR